MKRSWYLGIVLAVLAAVAAVLGTRVSSRAADPPAAEGYLGRADQVTANGIVEGARPEVAVRPEVAGTVVALPFRENQEAGPGDVLVELENREQRCRVELAEAQLARARAALDRLRNGERAETRAAARAAEAARRATLLNAEKDWERARALRDQRALSQEMYDAAYYHFLQARADYDRAHAERLLAEAPPRADDLAAAEAGVREAQARLRLARAELEKTRLRAPYRGRVLRVYAEPGELAGPNSSRPVLLFADLSRLRVRASVEELDAPRVRVGQAVVVTCDGLPGKEFRGTVSAVLPRMGRRSPTSDAPDEYKDVYYREVLIDLADGRALLLNLRVKVRILVEEDGSNGRQPGGRGPGNAH